MATVKKPRGPACVLAIGTAKPTEVIRQASDPDLKGETTIEKGHTHVPPDSLGKNKRILTDVAPSLDARQDSLVPLVFRLGKEVASVAFEKWGQPKEKITHLMFHSTSGVHMPGADCRFIELLGLPPDVKRTMLYHQGSYISGTLLRMAKDAAENNAGARILIVCSEIALGSFQGPCKDELGSLLAQAINDDGAAALIVGAEPDQSLETPLFELMSASQTIIPVSDGENEGSLSEMGLPFQISESVPELISGRADDFLRKLTVPFRMEGHWDSFFWAIHAGGPAILEKIREKLKLDPGKLVATRHVLSEYGNIGSASVFFVLDEIRRREAKGRNGESCLHSEPVSRFCFAGLWHILFQIRIPERRNRSRVGRPEEVTNAALLE